MAPFSDTKSELVILSTSIVNKSALNELSELSENDFTAKQHKVLFNVITSLNNNCEQVDIVAIRSKLIENNKLEEVGGDNFLGAVLQEQSTINFKPVFKRVKELAAKRHYFDLNNKILEQSNSLTIEELEQKAADNIQKLQMQNIAKLESISNISEQGIDKMLATNKFARTGLAGLDHKINGFYNTELIILGARPGVGKSALALHFARSFVKQQKKVLMFSLEMPNNETVLRMLAEKSNIGLNEIRSNKFNGQDKYVLEKGLKEISREMSGFYLVDNAFTLSKIRSLIKKHVELTGIDFVIIDYLQLIQHTGSSKDRHLQVGEISRTLKLLANELKIPILALSQLNRSVESRTHKVPQLSDLRESGSIEQDANVVLFLFKDEEIDNDNVELIVAKTRNGQIGRTTIRFNKPVLRFSDN